MAMHIFFFDFLLLEWTIWANYTNIRSSFVEFNLYKNKGTSAFFPYNMKPHIIDFYLPLE